MKRTMMLTTMMLIACVVFGKDIKTVVLTTTPQMHCESCEEKIKGNLRFEKGIKSVETNVEEQSVTIQYDADKTSEEKLMKAFGKFGYKAEKKVINKDASQKECTKKECDEKAADKKDCCEKAGEQKECTKKECDEKTASKKDCCEKAGEQKECAKKECEKAVTEKKEAAAKADCCEKDAKEKKSHGIKFVKIEP